MGLTPMPDHDDTPLPTNIADDETAIASALTSPTTNSTGAVGARGRIVAAAAIIMVGQLLSSVLGLVRIEALNVLFYGAASGAFIIALRPIQQVSDLVVAGSVSGVLIPTFVDYDDPAHRERLRRAYSTILNLVVILLSGAPLIL